MAKVTLSENRQSEKVYDPISLDSDNGIKVTMRRTADGGGAVLRCYVTRTKGETTEEIGNAVYNEGRNHASVSMNTLKGMSRETVLEAISTMTEALTLMMAEMEG